MGGVLAIAFISLVPNLVEDTSESEGEPQPPTVITLPAPIDADTPPLPTETSLGVFEWTKLVGNQKDIPLGDIYLNPFGEGYLSYSDGSVWLSPNSESWAIVSGASLFRVFSRTTINGRWALAYAPDIQLFDRLNGFQIFQIGDANWAPVQLPDPILPQIEGMSFHWTLSQPVESESVVVIPFFAREFVLRLSGEIGVEVSGAWVNSDGDDFSWHATPWSGLVKVLAVPGGGFAVYEGLSSQEADPEARVWTSRDGITWEDRGAPAFVNGPFDQFEVMAAGPNLLATVYIGDSVNHWLSKDGLTWAERGPSSLPPWAAIYPTDFGFAAMDFSRGDRQRFWISADGENWEAIQGPTSPPASLVSRPYGVSGELLFHATLGAEGARILWIGRLVPS